jgi:CGNR zinc finger
MAFQTSNQLRPDRPLEAVQFAIDFAQMNLVRGELTEISDRVRRFLVGVRDLVGGNALPREELVVTQRDALALLRGVVLDGVARADLQLQMFLVRPGVLPGRGQAPTFRNNSPVLATAGGSTRDRFLYRLIRLLEQFGVEKLQACAAPECGRLFLKVTRKEFCSARCQSRVYMRQRRQDEREQANKRTARHGKTRKK